MPFELDEEQVFIFPGTHSKHVTVKNGNVIDIKTYMTGEFFELLSVKSILSATIEKTVDLNNEKNKKIKREYCVSKTDSLKL